MHFQILNDINSQTKDTTLQYLLILFYHNRNKITIWSIVSILLLMVNLKTLHVSSLAYMPAFVSLKLSCTGSMLRSNFLGMTMLICIGTMLLFWPSACVFRVSYDYLSVCLDYSPAAHRSCWLGVSIADLGPQSGFLRTRQNGQTSICCCFVENSWLLSFQL